MNFKFTNENLREKAEMLWPELFTGGGLELTNGEFMTRRFGKYQPGIVFLLNEENCLQEWAPVDPQVNIAWDGDADYLRGEFWISKKGTNCFRPKEDGPHMLIRVEWGGPFITTRGDEYDEIAPLAIYSRRAGSNGGGTGYNYYVFPVNYRREISVDEI